MHMRLQDVTGKIVYITGGSAGIGLAVAQRFVAQGADVLIFARREAVLEEAVASLASAKVKEDQRVQYRVLDVSSVGQCQDVLAEAVASFGAPQVLINNAGRALPDYFENISTEQLEETFRINLFSCWNTIQALLPHMKEKGGYIVNVSSIAGLIGAFGFTDYCASKFALVGFSEALGSELKQHNIMVSVLCPPDTDTPGLAEENKNKPPETRAISAKARPLTADAVADALLQGMRKGRPIIIAGMDGKLTCLMKRISPTFVTWMMERAIRKVKD